MARTKETENKYIILVGKSEWKIRLGVPRLGLEDNIEIDLTGT